MPMERAPARGAPPAGLGSLGRVGRVGGQRHPSGVHRRAERGEDSVGQVGRSMAGGTPVHPTGRFTKPGFSDHYYRV